MTIPFHFHISDVPTDGEEVSLPFLDEMRFPLRTNLFDEGQGNVWEG